jgi:hypothetical protein
MINWKNKCERKLSLLIGCGPGSTEENVGEACRNLSLKSENRTWDFMNEAGVLTSAPQRSMSVSVP